MDDRTNEEIPAPEDMSANPPAGRKPRRNRWSRASGFALSALGAGYLLILAFPGVLFAHQVGHGRFRVFSDRPIDPRIVPVLDEAAARLARSTIDDPAVEHRLYLCDGLARRVFLAPKGHGAFGVTYGVRWNTILNRTDIPAALVFNDAAVHNRRSLAAVIAHERTHALLRNRFGEVACTLQPAWKIEGYCEYVGGESSFEAERGRRLIREGRSDPSSSFRYFRDYALVKYLIEVEGLTIDQIMARTFDRDELLARLRREIDRLDF